MQIGSVSDTLSAFYVGLTRHSAGLIVVIRYFSIEDSIVLSRQFVK